MKNILVTLLAFCFIAQPFYGMVLAETEEEMEYSWGVVTDISSNRLVVSEYDYDTDEESEVSYTIDPNVELVNVNSLEEIAIGYSVEIEFVIKDNDKIAKIITVEILEEEYIPEAIEY